MSDIADIHEHHSSPPSEEPPLSDDIQPHIDLTHTNLTGDQQQALLDLLQRYRDVFALSPEELGRTDVIKYTIDTGDSPPVRLRRIAFLKSRKPLWRNTSKICYREALSANLPAHGVLL